VTDQISQDNPSTNQQENPITAGMAMEKIKKFYGDKVDILKKAKDRLNNEITLSNTDESKANTYERKAQLLERSKKNSQSSLPNLYANLEKNANTLTSSKGNIFPKSIRYKYDPNTNTHNWENMPAFSAVFNQVWPSIKILGELTPNAEKYVDGLNKTKSVNPCFMSTGKHEKENDYLERKPGQADLREMEILKNGDINKDNISHCENSNCEDCIDCLPHQQELIKSVNGMFDNDSPQSNALRNLHFKNLLTILSSHSIHQNSRGNDAATCDDRSYEKCQEKHAALATSESMIAHRLHRAYEQDFHTSGGAGGGVHRDNFGIGNSKEAY
jgi:hypothetical protein